MAEIRRHLDETLFRGGKRLGGVAVGENALQETFSWREVGLRRALVGADGSKPKKHRICRIWQVVWDAGVF
jgi:hypothetical protein